MSPEARVAARRLRGLSDPRRDRTRPPRSPHPQPLAGGTGPRDSGTRRSSTSGSARRASTSSGSRSIIAAASPDTGLGQRSATVPGQGRVHRFRSGPRDRAPARPLATLRGRSIPSRDLRGAPWSRIANSRRPDDAQPLPGRPCAARVGPGSRRLARGAHGSRIRRHQLRLPGRGSHASRLMEDVALFLHLLGVLLFTAGIVFAGVAFESARRRQRPEEIALLLSLTRIGVLLVVLGGLLLLGFGLWLVGLEDVGAPAGSRPPSACSSSSLVLGGLGGQRPKRARQLAGSAGRGRAPR